MQIAIAESMRTDNRGSNNDFEPLELKDQLREAGMPVGLKNIGNTCYFNSLLQTYFQIPELVKLVLEYEPEVTGVPELKPQDSKAVQKNNVDFLLSLKHLFARMVKSNKKYQSTYDVMANLRNEVGEQYQTGDQQDVAEFHMNFLSCLLDSLKPKKKEEEKKVERQDSKTEMRKTQKSEQPEDTKQEESALGTHAEPDDMAVDADQQPGKFP